MTQAILYSALAASALALLIGVILARTISRPVRELTLATRAMATGNLNQKVKVRSKDELGELASSFNQMSTDLVESNRQRRQMTADIAHDLRTPLSVILGYTEALSDAILQGTPDIFEVIHDEAQHLSHLIEDLRTLSLADAGELTIVLRPTPPQSLLERTAAAHRVQVQQQDVSLEVETPADLPEVAVDPERMAQVLGNLVSNALRYTPQNGRIVLSAQAQADDLLLQVRDSGSGIASEDLPHIFERFYRSDKSRAQNGQSGLGLPIAKSLVEMHGGTLSAESVPGQGTTFTIRLPLTRPAPA
jgi:signal transduction histidine kinase